MAPKKRIRKRRRRVVSVSSSSSSSPSSPPSLPDLPGPSSESSSFESSSSSSDSESDSVLEPAPPPQQSASPNPPFLPNDDTSKNVNDDEQVLKERFRKFWMASVADAFKEDLEEIRKEPNLGQSRLALLIDSLASGATVFSSSSKAGQINEMEAAIGPNP